MIVQQKFKGSNIKFHIHAVVQHALKVNFNQQPISDSNFEHARNKTEIKNLDKEIKKLLKKGVIKEPDKEIDGERFSTTF